MLLMFLNLKRLISPKSRWNHRTANFPWSYTSKHLDLHESFLWFIILLDVCTFYLILPNFSCEWKCIQQENYNSCYDSCYVICAKDHLSSIRILKDLLSHIIPFTRNKRLSILLRAEACSLLTITQASDGRLRHVLLWLFTHFFGC